MDLLKLRRHLGPHAYQYLLEWGLALPEAADETDAVVDHMESLGRELVVVQVRAPGGEHHALIIQPDRETL